MRIIVKVALAAAVAGSFAFDAWAQSQGPLTTVPWASRSRTTMTAMGEKRGKSFDQMVTERITHIPAGRSGDPAEFGDACAYLCSAQAGFYTGQNVLIDGGAYPGTF